MFNFIDYEYPNARVNEAYIEELEKNLDIEFPKVLKDYYLNHNGAEIKECEFEKFGLEFCVVLIRALDFGTMPVEKVLAYNRSNSYIPKTFIPLAEDADDDDYYWDANDGKVYYLSLENVEHPKVVFDNVEEFFEMLNECCQ